MTRTLPLLLLAACGAPVADDVDADPLVVEAAGPHVVGTAAVTLDDAARGRTLDVQLWYPADEAARADALAGVDVLGFVPEAYGARLAELVADAPDPGTLRTAHAAWDAPASDAAPTWPLVVFSHCLDGTRFSTFTLAERLASHGVAVAAVDHAGGTLYDELDGAAAPLGTAFLDVRAGDVRFVLDALLGAGDALPADLVGRFDADRVGLMGHSFGGVTVGKVLDEDARPRAGLALAVPIASPLLPTVTLAPIDVPLMFVVATEDNSITELGNTAIRRNFDDANGPVWKVEVADAGHWSFSTICGITPGFGAGCDPTDVRQTDGAPFTYLDVDVARGVAASYATAFFRATLDDDAVSLAYLELARPDGVVDVAFRD